jgi:nucleotide-binding universal stress UspA family protein
LLGGAPCAVAIAPAGYATPARGELSLIGVGYDGHEEARAATAVADRLAQAFCAPLRLIAAAPDSADPHPVPMPLLSRRETGPARDDLRAQLDVALGTFPPEVTVDTALIDGDPAAVLDAQSLDLDLLVIGSRSYGPLRRVLLGDVATKVVSLAACPVIVTPRSATSVNIHASPNGDAAAARG